MRIARHVKTAMVVAVALMIPASAYGDPIGHSQRNLTAEEWNAHRDLLVESDRVAVEQENIIVIKRILETDHDGELAVAARKADAEYERKIRSPEVGRLFDAAIKANDRERLGMLLLEFPIGAHVDKARKAYHDMIINPR